MSRARIRVNSTTPTLSPSKTSQLINDSDFQTAAQVVAAIDAEASTRATADAELEAQIGAAFVKRVAAGELAVFDDGADNVPVADLTVELPYKSGGYTGCTVKQTGKNLVDIANQSNIAVGTLRSNTLAAFSAIRYEENTQYTISFDLADVVESGNREFGVVAMYVGYETPQYLWFYEDGGVSASSRTTDAGKTVSSLAFGYDESAYFTLSISNVMVERGSAKTDYVPYVGQTHTTDWTDVAGTIYGGTWDVTCGVLTSTLDENGDPLPTPITYQLTPVEVTTLLGDNVLSTDTGDVTVTYRADPTIEAERKVDKADYDPVAATASMTQPVGKDANGRLFTAPSGGGSSVNPVTKSSDMIYPVGVDGNGRLWASYAPDTLSWSQIQSIVRSGRAPTVFPIGYEFTTTKMIGNDATTITWRVVAHNHYKPENSSLTHSMALESKYVYGTAAGTYKELVFDAAEALYYCSEALPAGTYNFTWNYATGSMVNGTYQFTLTEGVPAGGQIVLDTNSRSTAITSCKIKTYGSVGSNTAIESNIAVTEGSGGTSLGTIGATTADSANLNCAQRIMWGSNNYAQSGARQWLNSAANLGSVWTPTNKFDRAPSWHTGSDTAYCGFMHGLGDDFLGAVQPAKIACRTNSVFEVDSLDGTEFTVNQVYELKDKFFLLSRPEIWGTWDSATYKDGTQLEYYEGLTQTELIKRDAAGSARITWLRSPNTSDANLERYVGTDGSLNGFGYVFAAFAVAPACIIA